MNFYLKIKKTLREGIEYLFMAMLVLTTNSVYNVMPEHPTLFTAILFLSAMLLLMIGKKEVYTILPKIQNRKFINIYLLCIVLINVFMIQSSFSRNLVVFGQFGLFLPVIILLIMTYIQNDRFYSFLEKFVNITVFLAVTSTILFALKSFKFIQPTSHPIVDWGGTFERDLYYGLLLQSKTHIGKNLGIFPEPPMYNLVLIFALLIEQCIYPSLYKDKKPGRKQWIRTICVLMAVITSKSITGYLLALLLFLGKLYIWYIANKEKINKKVRNSIYVLFIAMGIMAVVVYINKASSVSWAIRVDDYYATFFAWMEHPVFGNGYGSIQSVYPYMSLFRMDNIGLANSIGWILVQGGIPYFILYFYPLFISVKKNYKGNKIFALFSFIVLIDLVFTIFSDIPIAFFTLGIVIANILGDETWIISDQIENHDKSILILDRQPSLVSTVILTGINCYWVCVGKDSKICLLLSEICIVFIPCLVLLSGTHKELTNMDFEQNKVLFFNFLIRIYQLAIITYIIIFVRAWIVGDNIFDLSYVYLSEITMGSVMRNGLLKHLWVFWVIIFGASIIKTEKIPATYLVGISLFVFLFSMAAGRYLLPDYENHLQVLMSLSIGIVLLTIGKEWTVLYHKVILKIPYYFHLFVCLCFTFMMVFIQLKGYVFLFQILIAFWAIIIFGFLYRTEYRFPDIINEHDLFVGFFYLPPVISLLYSVLFDRISHGYMFVFLIICLLIMVYKRKEAKNVIRK